MNNPLISIITPLYNTEQYIAETIESVLSQSYYNWEMIIVDDNSTDSSYIISQQYAKKDKRILLTKRDTEIKGGAACRNVGIKLSKGEYIIFLDSDDILHSKCLEKRLEIMRKDSHLDFCVFQMDIISPNGEGKDMFLTHLSDNYLYAFLSYKLPWQTTCPIWKSSFLKDKLIGFDEKFPRLQDPEFHTSALLIENVQFRVYDDISYLDCSYRFFHKKINIKNALIGFYMYLEKFYVKVLNRSDKNKCIKALSELYDAIILHYSQTNKDEMIDNVRIISKINKYFFAKGIINKREFNKTQFFLFYIKNKLFRINIINQLLLKVKIDHFYAFRIPKN